MSSHRKAAPAWSLGTCSVLILRYPAGGLGIGTEEARVG